MSFRQPKIIGAEKYSLCIVGALPLFKGGKGLKFSDNFQKEVQIILKKSGGGGRCWPFEISWLYERKIFFGGGGELVFKKFPKIVHPRLLSKLSFHVLYWIWNRPLTTCTTEQRLCCSSHYRNNTRFYHT